MSIHARHGQASASAVALPPEIGFLLAQGVPYALLAHAAALARGCGSDAATALLNAGLMSEEAFYRALARALGTTFLASPALGETRYPQILEVGAAPLADGSAHRIVAAPRGRAVARLIEAAGRLAALPAITTPTRLRLAAFERHADAIAGTASDALAQHFPEWSCRPGPQTVDIALAGLVLALVLTLTMSPNAIGQALLLAVQVVVLSMLAVRVCALAVDARTELGNEVRRLRDAELPTYTVLVALYREAAVVPRLIHSLGKLDYPVAKLDIKFLIEADDEETAAAFRAAPMPARFEVVVAPSGLPRTKPRALNVALPLARGDLLVVYDAEDVADRLQLRDAASLFARAPATTACLQGRLVVDNVNANWLTRFFAIEYAALFDVVGPALAAWRMPIPLGGTTTHFRTRVLRELHGWDAWNVTEDADLGMRLAIAGYHVGDLPSATFEEAPERVPAWLRQRTRWMKGFLQTSFTHARHPVETFRRLGPVRSLCALTLLPATVVSALVYPVLTGWTLVQLLVLERGAEPGLLEILTRSGSIAVLVGGFAVMWLPGALGCIRRGWWDLLPWVLALPLFFVLVSLAAWLAVFELARHPHRWNKTEHGLSRVSRSGALHLRRESSSGVRSASPVPMPPPAASAAG